MATRKVTDRPLGLSRRSMLKGTAGLVTLAAAAALTGFDDESAQAASPGRTGGSSGKSSTDRLFGELDAKIQHAMEKYAIPGVAVAVVAHGQEHVRGFGITSVDAPQPVDGHTLFRIGSTTKTFTGTSMMRLVEAGQVD